MARDDRYNVQDDFVSQELSLKVDEGGRKPLTNIDIQLGHKHTGTLIFDLNSREQFSFPLIHFESRI